MAGGGLFGLDDPGGAAVDFEPVAGVAAPCVGLAVGPGAGQVRGGNGGGELKAGSGGEHEEQGFDVHARRGWTVLAGDSRIP